MRVFLTGGSGFLGQVVIRHLKAAGHDIFALTRADSAKTKVEKLGAIAVKGNLGEIEAIRPMMNGIEVVIHCAAPVEFWGPWDKFEREIVDATMDLARLANECGVRRFIQISSEAAIQNQDSLIDVDESLPYPAEPNSYYGKAKMLAERSLLKSSFGMEIVILRPTFIWGNKCPSLELVESKVRSGKFVWIDGGNAPFESAHVENVAHAIVAAITSGKNKNVYFITDGESQTVREFFSKFFEVRGITPPWRSMPAWVATLSARLIERLWRGLNLTGVPPLTKFDVAFVSQPRRYRIKKAIEELGYSPSVSRDTAWSRLQVAGDHGLEPDPLA